MELQYYFADDFSAFEDYFAGIKKTVRRYLKNEPVNGFGEPLDEMYYITSGTMSGSFIHESGNVKTSSFYGKGYLAPLYFPGEIEMMRSFAFTAVTDLEVFVFNRIGFERYVNSNPDLNMAMNGQELANQLFSTGMEKICNFFYIYLKNTNEHDQRIPFSQQAIAEFVGLNRANVAKYLKILREEQIIDTRRNQIFIINMEKLRQFCSQTI